jgi:hypothetical protein
MGPMAKTKRTAKSRHRREAGRRYGTALDRHRLVGHAWSVGRYQSLSIEFDLFELDNAFVNKCARPAR